MAGRGGKVRWWVVIVAGLLPKLGFWGSFWEQFVDLGVCVDFCFVFLSCLARFHLGCCYGRMDGGFVW